MATLTMLQKRLESGEVTSKQGAKEWLAKHLGQSIS